MNTHNRFLTAAQSVADSLAAMAEPAVGGTRWETLTYAGDRQYSTAVFGGMAGVIFLFSDLFRINGDTTAREVAEAAAMWVELESKSALTESEADPSLYSGLAGHGQMFLHLFEATGRDRWLRCALARAKALGRAVYPDTHMLSGSSGSLIFLLQAYHTTGDETLLATARALGDDILRCATRDATGVRWAWERPAGRATPHGTFFGTGFGHGASGVAYALAELWAVTRDDALQDAVTGTIAWIESVAIDTAYGVGWGRWPDDPNDSWCTYAADFGDAAMAYQHDVDGAVQWMGDEPGNYSPDFMLGSAGLGHYFLRIARPTDVHMPLMVVPQDGRTDS